MTPNQAPKPVSPVIKSPEDVAASEGKLAEVEQVTGPVIGLTGLGGMALKAEVTPAAEPTPSVAPGDSTVGVRWAGTQAPEERRPYTDSAAHLGMVNGPTVSNQPVAPKEEVKKPHDSGFDALYGLGEGMGGASGEQPGGTPSTPPQQ